MLDYLIKDGLVVDGSGDKPKETNVGIRGDEIVFTGRDSIQAKEIIDAKGLVVSPGFIDTHGHSEFSLLADGRAESKIDQGVTTEINGNCGLSAAPLYGEARERREADIKEFDIKERWSTFSEYFNCLNKRGIALNIVTLCGHGNLRGSVIGYKKEKPDKEAMFEMKRLLHDSVKEGAIGISTGLIYPPGIYSDTDELIQLSNILLSVSSNGIYVSHMRSEGDYLIESIEEVIRIAGKAGVYAHVSHIKTQRKQNWHKIDESIKLIERARSEGIRLTCDRYPYTASSTDLDTVLPSWVFEGGLEAELKRLKDPVLRKKIIKNIPKNDDDYWQDVYVSSVVRSENRWMESENIKDISLKINKPPVDTLIKILIDESLRAGGIFFSMNEDNLRRYLVLDYVMIGSDSAARRFSGPTRKGKPHPRGFSSFPRFIGRYVRDEGLMDISDAIKKITKIPAMTFNLKKRGLIREGFFADIVIFDHEKIIDKSTFKEPYMRPDGIYYVIVNGVEVLREGEFTGHLPGRILKN